MRKLHLHILLLLILSFTSCLEEQEPDFNPLKETKPYVKEKPVTEGKRKVNIKVDTKYDFSNVRGYSFVDLTALKDNPSLIVPNISPSMLYFMDGDNLVATVLVDSSATEVEVNATNVAISLFDGMPAYIELTDEQRREFMAKAISTEPFKFLVNAVDNSMQTKGQLFSEEPGFADAYSKLNRLILTTYFGEAIIGGRVSEGPDPKDEGTWINQLHDLFENQLHSYVRVIMESEKPTKTKSTSIMDPRPYLDGQTELGISKMPDGYYDIKIRQDDDEVNKKNAASAAEKALGLVLGVALDKYLKGSGCYTKMYGKVSLTVALLLGKAKSNNDITPKEVLEEMRNSTVGIVKDILTEQECLQYLGGATIALLTRVIAFKHPVSAAIVLSWNATDCIQLWNYLEGWLEPISLDFEVQFHHGAIIPGGLELRRGLDLNEKYAPSDTVLLEIEFHQISEWSINIEREGININWIVEDGNGTIANESNITSVQSGLSSEDFGIGFGSAVWTLPAISGKYEVNVEVLDKDNNHIIGSPVTFSTTVDACINAEPMQLSAGGPACSVCPSGVTISYSSPEGGPGSKNYPGYHNLIVWVGGGDGNFYQTNNYWTTNDWTGDKNNGTFVFCSDPWLTKCTPDENNVQDYTSDFKIAMINECDVLSAPIDFSITTYYGKKPE